VFGIEAAKTGPVNPVQSIDLGVAESSHQEIDFRAQSRRHTDLWIVGFGLVGLMLKLMIAFNTFGTSDVVMFYQFAKALTQHDLGWLYQRTIYFNHPPLTAHYLQFIFYLDHQAFFQASGLTFPVLLRLPGIIADFVVLMVLLQISKKHPEISISAWVLALFALSPVSLMVSGFHGNTDPVMVMFLVLASWMCLKKRPWLCALFFALSCQIKIISLLFLPIFFFFWQARCASLRFFLLFALTSIALWAEPLLKFPVLFLKNVLSYGSFWGLWGITYWLRLTHWRQFNGTGFFSLPVAAAVTALLLKIFIIAAVVVLAWRRRCLHGDAILNSIAYAWIIFFVFSPGVCAQYMVWLAPFVLVLCPVFYVWLTATSSVFLFFFYNLAAGEWPWYSANANASRELSALWSPWSLWPWVTLLIGMILLWKKATALDHSLRLFSLQAVRE
jgi:hypothetical protein